MSDEAEGTIAFQIFFSKLFEFRLNFRVPGFRVANANHIVAIHTRPLHEAPQADPQQNDGPPHKRRRLEPRSAGEEASRVEEERLWRLFKMAMVVSSDFVSLFLAWPANVNGFEVHAYKY